MQIRLREILKESVRRNNASGILFSGGLDTSILALLNPKALAITVSLEDSGEDIGYARLLAKRLGLKHVHRNIKTEEALESIPEIIRILKSFDPAIPNDIAIYFGLKEAKKLGVKEIMTGDGSDEIFAGYTYMRKMRDLGDYMKRISLSMEFNSNIMGKSMKIRVRQPYLDKELLKYSLKIPVKYKLRKEKGVLRGKWILRKTFEKELPAEIIWQKKRPIECGSGMTNLRKVISERISNKEIGKYPVRFINKEHFYYYRIYREIVGDVPRPNDGEKACTSCGAGMKRDAFHCRICGGLIPSQKRSVLIPVFRCEGY